MDILKNLADSGGNICKAVLCVRNPETYKTSGKEKAADDLQAKIMKAAENKLKDNGSSSFSNIGYKEISKLAAESKDFLAIAVKYNPESIVFDSAAGTTTSKPREGMGGKGDTLMDRTETKTQISMRCKLIFEDINVNDAFINNFETLNLNPGQLVSLGASAYKKLKKRDPNDSYDEPYSVRRYLEGFMSLLIHDVTREVIFYWGKCCFHGILTEVTSNYKMFNKVGAPILGEVDITITQYNFQKNSEPSQNDKQWEKAYNKVFGTDEEWDAATSSSSGVDSVLDAIGKVGIL